MKRTIASVLLMWSGYSYADRVVCVAGDGASEVARKINEEVGNKKMSAPSISVFQGYVGKQYSATITVMCVTITE